jgi:hypothetical protein
MDKEEMMQANEVLKDMENQKDEMRDEEDLSLAPDEQALNWAAEIPSAWRI